MRAVVTGMIVTYPVGGVAWDYGQYVLGLERMGFEVYYLEDTGWQTYDPNQGLYGENCSYGVEFLRESLAALSPSLAKRWQFHAMDGRTYGMNSRDFSEVVAEADLFLNVSNSCLLREEYMQCKKKVLIDTDPGWNHFVNFPKWDKNPGWQGSHSWREHDYFFTYAEQIGKPGCELPTFDLAWHTSRPPVVLEHWNPKPPAKVWTTVMTWDNFRRPIEYNGVRYGTKEMEFGRVETLPSRTSSAFELAVGGSTAPRERWQQLGWSVIDSHSVSKTPEDYRSYIESSRGEFSVAKNVYAATRCGWFSCRSVCYLAAGRPVVVQDTSFSDFIPTGQGLFSFSTLEEAVKAVETVEKDYEFHQKAAQEIARDYFSAGKVLGKLLNEVGIN